MQRIVVATDFSPAARRAVLRAALIAKASGAELTVLHALPQRGAIEHVLHRHELDHTRMAAGAERSLRREIETIREAHGIEAKPSLAEGVAHHVIAATGTALRADLVVVGARGESEFALGAQMLGSTAFRCLGEVDRAFLVVRGEVGGRYYKVLAALDLSPLSNDVLEWALELSRDGGICEALHVFDAPYAQRLRAHEVEEPTIEAYAAEERERAIAELDRVVAELSAGERVRSTVVRGNPVAAILFEIREREPDLVVLGQRSLRTRTTRLANIGSVSMRAMLEAAPDVLLTG